MPAHGTHHDGPPRPWPQHHDGPPRQTRLTDTHLVLAAGLLVPAQGYGAAPSGSRVLRIASLVAARCPCLEGMEHDEPFCSSSRDLPLSAVVNVQAGL